MRRTNLSLLAVGAFALSALSGVTAAEDWRQSPDKAWTFQDNKPEEKAGTKAWIRPQIASIFTLDSKALADTLVQAPREFTEKANSSPLIMTIPAPDGSYKRFAVMESPIWEAGLEKHMMPGTMTYRGQGLDDPNATIRFDWTESGFHASVMSPDGSYFVDPWFQGETTTYSSYYRRDYTSDQDDWFCGVANTIEEMSAPESLSDEKISNGTQLRTFRLACSATIEYTAFHGGTAALGQAAIVTAINRVNQVYEAELAARLTLVANNINIVFVSSDSFSNTNGPAMLPQNQSVVDTNIGSANYDIGHVFSTGGGGIAALPSVCIAGSKAQGVTGSGSPTGDAFWIDYVAHEMGHQFGGNHTFNSSTDNCGGGNRNNGTAYEIGSGSTIQAYAGICGTDDLQPNSDAYFVHISLEEIIGRYSTTTTCGVQTATSNTVPTVSAGSDFTIPAGTPFTLTAVGNDGDGDTLTYCWDERDLGVTTTLAAADNGTSPIFRSRAPSTSPSRTFPRLSTVIANTTDNAEKYPASNRTMNARVYVRDNRSGGGGINHDDAVVTISTAVGPLAVTAPNTAVTWNTSPQTVTWNVAGTTGAPTNTANVNILLSTDGGNTFPTTLVANTPNDGTQSVALPTVTSSTCRVKVEPVGNIYWDMSNTNFTINFAGGAPVVTNVTSSSANGTYTTGTIPIQVTFNAAVVVSGTPVLALNTTPSRNATYASGSGTATLTFNYLITAGDSTTDLDYASTGALSLSGGTIRDNATNTVDALLGLATPGASGSLGFNKDIIVGLILNVANASLTEGDTGSANLTFTVTLGTANPGPGNITVNYTLSDITATGGTDYTATGGTVTFATGQSSRPIDVPVFGDYDFEGHETFGVLLSGASGAGINVGSATGTITNNDSPRRLYGVNGLDGNLEEGFVGFDPAAIASTTASFPNATVQAFVLPFTSNYVGCDFIGTNTATAYTMTFSGGAGATESLYAINPVTGVINSQTNVTMPTVAGVGGQYFVGMRYDNAGAGRMLVLTMDTTGAAVGNRRTRISTLNVATGVLTTVVDANGTASGLAATTDEFQGFAVNSAGTTGYTLRVPTSGTGTDTLYSINLTTGAMTAIGGVGGLSVNLAWLWADLAVDPLDNCLYMSATLTTGASNYYRLGTAGTPSNTATLISSLDSTSPNGQMRMSAFGFVDYLAGTPTISISDPVAITEGNSGTQNLTFVVTKSATNAAPITMNWEVGGSINAADVTGATTGTITFPAAAGSATQNVVITANGDTSYEMNEFVQVLITNNSPNSILSDAAGSTRIDNDDAPTPGYMFGVDMALDGLAVGDPTNFGSTGSRSLETTHPNSYQGGTFVGTDTSTFYVLDFTTSQLRRINTTTGALISATGITGNTAGYTQFLAIAYDPVAAVTRVLSRNGTTGAVRLNTINTTTAVLTPAAADLTGQPATTFPLGMAVHPSTGVVYYMAIGDPAVADFLCSINTATNAITQIGNVGFDVQGTFFTDIAFRPQDGLLYWTSLDALSEERLFTLNTATGVATAVNALETEAGLTPGVFQISALGFVPAGANPTITLASAAPNPTNAAITVTATTSASTTDFVSGGVTPTNATVSGFSGSGTAYSWTLTPTAQGPFSCVVNAGTFTSSATPNLVSNTLSRNFDSVAPTVSSIVRVGTNPTNAASVSWTVTFSESVTGVATGNFALANTGLTGPSITGVSGSGTTWTVTASTGTGSGSLGLNMTNSTGVADSATNAVSGLTFTGEVFTVDKAAPTVSSIVRVGTNPTNAASVSWTVTFSESVTGVATGNFTLANTGLTGPSITGVTGSGTTWTVTASTGTGSGSLGLNMTNSTGVADSATNAVSGLTFTGEVFTVDKASPTVSSINRAGTNPTNAASVSWTVTFSESVTGVATGNFALANTGLTGPSITGVSGSGTTWTVTASTGTGSGSLGLNMTNSTGVADSATNAVSGLTFTGQVYTVDKAAPTVSSIVRAGTNPTNAASVSWTVTFSESVTGVATGNFALANTGLTGPSITGVSGSGTTWTVTANTGTGSGSLGLNMTNSTGVADSATNAVSGLTFTGQVYTVDKAAPTVSSIVRVGTNPTNAASVSWTVTFSESVTGVATGNFALANTGLTGPSITGVTGSGTTWTVTANTGTGSGSLGLNMTNSTGVADSATNAVSGLTFTGEVFTVDKAAPTVSSIVRASTNPTNAASVSWTVTFSESVTGVATGNFALANTGLTGPSITGVSGSGTTWTVTANTGTGSGSLGLNMTNSTGVADAATNAVSGLTFTGEVYTVDKAAPTVSTIVRASTNPTNATSVNFTVTFSESVLNVATGNFALSTTGVSGASITGVSGTGATRTVAVSTGTGDGTIRLDLTSALTITDAVGNAISGLPFTSGETYTVNKTAPIVSSIVRANPNPTNAASVNFTLTFSEAVTGVGTGDFALTTTGVSGASITSVSADTGATRTVTVNTGSGDGTIRLDLVDDDSILNGISTPIGGAGAGNGNFTSGEVYSLDRAVPTATLTTLAADPTNAAIAVTVTLSEASTTFVSGNVSPTNAVVSGFSGSGLSYTFTLTPTAQGSFSAQVAAGAFTDLAGNASIAASNSLSRTFDSVAPAGTLVAVADSTRVGTALNLAFNAADASAMTTTLWVLAPGSGTWADTGLAAQAGASGSFNWTTTVGNNGLYQFAARSVDAAGNTETVPAAAETSVLLNTVANGAFTQTTATANDTLLFPMTDDLDMEIALTGSSVGGSITLSRTTPLGAAPAGLQSARLINEFLSISESGLGASWTAQLTWAFDPTSDDALTGSINQVYRYESSVQAGSFAVSPVGTDIIVTGISDFSEWYAGNNDTAVEDWSLFDTR